MSVTTLTFSGTDIVKVSYDSKSGDMTVTYHSGAVYKFLEVPATLISNVEDFKKDGMSDAEILTYLKDTGLTKINRSRTLPFRQFRYTRVLVKKAKANMSEDFKDTEEPEYYDYQRDLRLYSSAIEEIKGNTKDKKLIIKFQGSSKPYEYVNVEPEDFINIEREYQKVKRKNAAARHSVGKQLHEDILHNLEHKKKV